MSAASHAPTRDLRRLYRKVSWRILPWLTLGYIVAYLDRVNVGFAKLSMLGDLGLSEAAYGFGAGIFFFGYLLLEVPSNLALHRVGARVWIARIMVTWGIVSALMAFTAPIARTLGLQNETVFYTLRFLLGVSEAGFFPGIILYLTYWYPSAMHSRVMAVVLLGNPVSFIVGAPVSGALMAGFGKSGLLSGWQWMFIAEAVPACLLGVLTLFVLDRGPSTARWLGDGEKAELARRLGAETAGKHDVPLARLYALPILWLLALIYVLLSVGIYGVNFWIPTIIREAGVRSVLDVGFISAVPYVAGAAAMLWIARRAESTGRHRAYAVLTAAASGAGLIACAALPGNLAATLIGIAVAVGGSLSAIALFWGLPGAFFSGATAAAGIAIINSLGALGGFFGPYLLGVFTDAFGSTRYGLMVLGLCLFAAALLIGLGTRRAGRAAPAAVEAMP